MADVLVVGGGLAGTACALELARLGLRVALARRGWGATATFGGPLELAASPALGGSALPSGGVTGAQPALGWTLSRHLEDIVAHRPQHPFARLGAQRSAALMTEGTLLLDRALQEGGLGVQPWAPDAPLALYPGTGGTLRPAATHLRARTQQAALSWAGPPQTGVAKDASWGVLDLADWGAPLGPRALAGWRYDAGRMGAEALGPARLVALRAPQADASSPGAAAGTMQLARHLDALDAAEALARSVVPLLPAGLTGVVVPPVLGLGHHAEVLALWQQILGLPVVEAAAALPSVAGVRLMLALEAARAAQQIEELEGSIVALHEQGGRVTGAVTAAGTEVHANAFVLATGRHLGGGLRWPEGETASESLLGLPLVGDEGPVHERLAMELTRRRPYAPQPLARVGVACDAQMRVMSPTHEPFVNLWAAGLVQAGFAPHEERSSDGVALCTALAAAADIAERLRPEHRAPRADAEPASASQSTLGGA